MLLHAEPFPRTFMQELPSPHDLKTLHLQDLTFQLVITRDMNYYLLFIGRDNRSRRNRSSQKYKASHWRKLPGSVPSSPWCIFPLMGDHVISDPEPRKSPISISWISLEAWTLYDLLSWWPPLPFVLVSFYCSLVSSRTAHQCCLPVDQ